jgi:S1-C subfamily serine protease
MVTLGHPNLLDGDATLSWGLVTAVNRRIHGAGHEDESQRVIQATYQSAGGSSGSPVFTLDGEVIGIHTSSSMSPAGTATTFMSYAVPVDILHKLLGSTIPSISAPPRDGSNGRALATTTASTHRYHSPPGFIADIFDTDSALAMLLSTGGPGRSPHYPRGHPRGIPATLTDAQCNERMSGSLKVPGTIGLSGYSSTASISPGLFPATSLSSCAK